MHTTAGGQTEAISTQYSPTVQYSRLRITPCVPDAIETDAGDTADPVENSDRHVVQTSTDLIDVLPLGTAIPQAHGPGLPRPWLQHVVRRLIREFLCTVPRSQATTTLQFPRPDGSVRTIPRAELTAGIERLRPRQRVVIRLVVEEGKRQKDVCLYLHGTSARTVQRDLAGALDLLSEL